MKSQNLQELINRFFENKFSKETQLLFRYWFRLNSDQKDKDLSMENLWENSPSSITDKTWEDLAKIQKKISYPEIAPNRNFFKVFVKYAAIALLALLSSISTYYFTSQSKQQDNPKFVEFFVPNGVCQKVLLADGTAVWVNAGSVLIYPEKFTADTRSVYLSGEANFQVTKNPKQPFIVKTKYIDVKALGTTFNVQSYPSSVFTIATLEEGSIKVDFDNNSNPSKILKPNEQLAYSHLTHEISINKVDASKLASWKDGYLIFRGAKFEEVVATIERKYNVQINYDAEKYNKQSYYVRFNPNESLEEALLVLSQISGKFKFSVQKSTVYIN